MNGVLVDLLERISSVEAGVQNDAILQLGLLLEKNTFPERASNNPFYTKLYEDELSSELKSITLDETAQKEIIERLHSLILCNQMPPGIFWPWGKASGKVGFRPLLDSIGIFIFQLP